MAIKDNANAVHISPVSVSYTHLDVYKRQAMHRADVFYELLLHFVDLEFEARRECMLIFSICLGYSKDNKFVTVDYLVSQPKTISLMSVSYTHLDVYKRQFLWLVYKAQDRST